VWHNVRKLVVVDDGEGSQISDDGIGSDVEAEGSTRSDGALSEISEPHEVDNSSDCEEWQDQPEEEAQDLVDVAGDGALSRGSDTDRAPTFAATSSDSAEHLGSGHEAMALSAGADANADAIAATEAGTLARSSSPRDGSFGVLPFDVFPEDVEPADHYFLGHSTLGTRALMMAVRREMGVLRKGLEGGDGGIVIRAFPSRSDLYRAMVTGPPETPYALVPFFFDLALPSEYPREPPLAHFHAHYVGNERLNPNLYVDGKVCLSLLGTWSGPSWEPQRSTLLQVLVSLQGLVLVEEPPGVSSWAAKDGEHLHVGAIL